MSLAVLSLAITCYNPLVHCMRLFQSPTTCIFDEIITGCLYIPPKFTVTCIYICIFHQEPITRDSLLYVYHIHHCIYYVICLSIPYAGFTLQPLVSFDEINHRPLYIPPKFTATCVYLSAPFFIKSLLQLASSIPSIAVPPNSRESVSLKPRLQCSKIVAVLRSLCSK